MVTEYKPAEMLAGVVRWAALVDCGRPAVNVGLAPTGLRQCREGSPSVAL